MKKVVFAVFASLVLSQTAAHAVGYSVVDVPDSGHASIETSLWYPSDVPVPDKPNTAFLQALALDAEPSGGSLPVVIISHGYGGAHAGHADAALALAEAGYVVAAPLHTGNNYRDLSSPIERWALDRPRHLSRVLDYLQSDWSGHKRLADEQAGVFGFSAGGYTALSVIGAVPNIEHAGKHCERDPEEYVCAEGMIAQMLAADMGKLPASAWGYDARFSAAAIAAPGLGIAYDEKGLANIEAAVQLWSGMDDHSVPHATNALAIAEALPKPAQTYWIKDAGHFAFMLTPCERPAFRKHEPETYQMVCGDKPSFDRREFHRDMNAAMVRFFDSVLRD